MASEGEKTIRMIKLYSSFIPPGAGEAVKRIVESGWLNTGKQEQRFREKLQKMFGFDHCLATNSCTSALRASLAAVGVGHGDEVVTTPWTMPATNTVILEQGAVPIFADIEYDTLNIDPESVAEKITDKTKAVMVVHYAGAPCDLDGIRRVAGDHGLPVVQDAAQALGAKYRGVFIGRSDGPVCFSFQATKVITSGDGGVIATDNLELYGDLKKRIWYGIDKESRVDTPLGRLPGDIEILGFKYNMNDLAAALGLAGLGHFDRAFDRRQEITMWYREAFNSLDRVDLLRYPDEVAPSYWMFPIHVEERLKFARYMRREGIEVSVHYSRNDQYSIFGGMQDLPITERVNEDIIHIPIHTALSEDQIDKIIETIKKWARVRL